MLIVVTLDDDKPGMKTLELTLGEKADIVSRRRGVCFGFNAVVPIIRVHVEGQAGAVAVARHCGD